jgi:hypothetical protein
MVSCWQPMSIRFGNALVTRTNYKHKCNTIIVNLQAFFSYSCIYFIYSLQPNNNEDHRMLFF